MLDGMRLLVKFVNILQWNLKTTEYKKKIE